MPAEFKPWKDNPVEYLVRVRFPLERHYTTVMLSPASRSAIVRDEAYVKQAADYRAVLQKLSPAELLDLVQATSREEFMNSTDRLKDEEAKIFYNQPAANLEVAHWARMSVWTLDQATALSLGKDPRRVNWENTRSTVQVSAFAAGYRARRDIILSAMQAGQLWDPVLPGVFIAWAERMAVELPSQLVDAVRSLGVQIADWKTAYERQKLIAETAEAKLMAEKKAGIQATAEHAAYIQKLSADYRRIIDACRLKIADLERSQAQPKEAANQLSASKPVAVEKSLGARERESLLKLVIGMAVAGYRYDPRAIRSDRVSEIASDLEKTGVALDVDTVRKYLREARELLPAPETEQNG